MKTFRWDRFLIILCILAGLVVLAFAPSWIASHYNPFNIFSPAEYTPSHETFNIWELWILGILKVGFTFFSMASIVMLLKFALIPIYLWLTEPKDKTK